MKKDLKKSKKVSEPKVTKIDLSKKTSKVISKVKKHEKNVSEMKKDNLNYILYAIGIIIIALGVLFNNQCVDTKILGIVLGTISIPTKLVGLLMIGTTGVVSTIKKNENPLIKSLLIILGIVFAATWLFPQGTLNGSEFAMNESYGLGFNSVKEVIYNGSTMIVDKIIFLLVIALFYKVASSTGAYNNVVNCIANKLKGKEKTAVLFTSVLVILLISFISEIYVVLFFLPFILSILSKLKVDKTTAFAVTFGALMVGVIASPYGTETLAAFKHYASFVEDTAFDLRLVLQVCIVILYTVFVALRLKEMNKDEVFEEQFLIEEENKKANNKPLIAIFIITLIFMLIGYIDWFANFEITVFQDFHKWLFELQLGDYKVFELIIGAPAEVSMLGALSLYDGATFLLIMITLLCVSYKISVAKFIDKVVETFKFTVKPVIVLVLISTIFFVGFKTQFYVSIGHYFLDLTPDFNPFLNVINAGLSGLFSADAGYTAFLFSSLFAERYAEAANVASLTYTSMAGLIQLIVPMSPLLIGLYYTNVSYKKWIKYIALFVLGIFIILTILLTVTTYLG